MLWLSLYLWEYMKSPLRAGGGYAIQKYGCGVADVHPHDQWTDLMTGQKKYRENCWKEERVKEKAKKKYKGKSDELIEERDRK